MIELLFVACLVSAPDNCQERRLVYVDVSPMECLMGAQPELAKWIAERPHFRIKRWKCQATRVAERET